MSKNMHEALLARLHECDRILAEASPDDQEPTDAEWEARMARVAALAHAELAKEASLDTAEDSLAEEATPSPRQGTASSASKRLRWYAAGFAAIVGTLLVAVGAVFTNARAIVIGLAIVVVMLGTAQVTATQSSARIRSCANTSGEQSGEGLTFDTSPDGNAATAQNPTGPDLLAKRFMATSGGFVTGSAAIVGSIVAILIAGLTNAGNWALVVGLALVLVVLGTAQVTATRSSARTRSRANTNGAQRREQCLHP